MIENNRVFSQVVWKPVQNKAPDLYNFIENFNFDLGEFTTLLEMYNKAEVKSAEEAEAEEEEEEEEGGRRRKPGSQEARKARKPGKPGNREKQYKNPEI